MANVPQLGAPGGDDDSQEMPCCQHCGHAIFFEHAYDCPAISRQQQATYPIPLSPEQESTIKEWAASSGLWGSQKTVEINLRTFARMVLKHQVRVRAGAGRAQVIMSSVTTEQIELEWWSNGVRNALDGLATTHNDLAREFFVFCAYVWAVKAAHHARRLLKLTGQIPEDE